MKDIKVIDTLKELDYIEKARLSFPVGFFAEAVAYTRKKPGVSIQDIAKCFKAQFEIEEIESLIKELKI